MPSSNPVFLYSTWCGVVGMSCALLINSCITVTFIKRWMLLHTKLNNSQMYFRDILIYMISAYHFRPCITAREQCQLSIVLKSCLGTCACKED